MVSVRASPKNPARIPARALFRFVDRKGDGVGGIGAYFPVDGGEVDGQTELGTDDGRGPQDLIGFVKGSGIGGDATTAVGNRKDDAQQNQESQGGQEGNDQDAVPGIITAGFALAAFRIRYKTRESTHPSFIDTATVEIDLLLLGNQRKPSAFRDSVLTFASLSLK